MIEVHNVSKKIKHRYVLDHISYTFESRKIYGLFGKNGSGKTMLLRALAGLIIPTEGEININNQLLHKDLSFPKSTGVIIENMELLPQYDAYTNLLILSKIKKQVGKREIEDALSSVGLDPYSKVKVKKYSLGMKQRLNIAQAIFEKPSLLLLDEPTNAIDDEGVGQIQHVLLEEKKRGATIIITSHHKEDIENICDIRLKMSDGKLVYDEK